MSKPYKVIGYKLTMGDDKGQIRYNVRPASYGTLTTEDVARQISEESAMTSGDVKAVLDRYAYYVSDNLKKGYNIQLLGFGTIRLRFLTTKGVADIKDANATLVRAIIPTFRPSFTMLNGNRQYHLLNGKIELVNVADMVSKKGADAGSEP